jgi:hypothetical protein
VRRWTLVTLIVLLLLLVVVAVYQIQLAERRDVVDRGPGPSPASSP